MRKNWLLIAIGLLIALLAVAAIACDGDDDDDGETPTTTEAVQTPEAAPTEGETPEAAPTEGETPEAAPTEGETPEAGTTPSAPTVIVSEHPGLGSILTDAEGRTLYTFAEDGPNVSTCQSDPCPGTWPPLTIESETPVAGEGVPGQLGVIERDDGSRQVTHDSAPLYRFRNDSAPGDANGQGVGGRWFAVQVGQ